MDLSWGSAPLKRLRTTALQSHFKRLQSFCMLLFMVHVSDPYSTILPIIVFISCFFRFLFGLFLSNSLLFEKLKMPLSYCCPSFNFHMAFGISCNHSVLISAFFHLLCLFSSNV